LIHLVDLDGAKSGHPVNVEPVRSIVKQVKVPCQLGGGVRDRQTISTWLDAGLERVVVGTQALRDPDWFCAMIDEFPGRLVLGLDARDGKVAAQGWLETSDVVAVALAEQFEGLPLAAIVYTDIARDGTLEGPNLEAIGSLANRVKTPVIASGGVGSLTDLQRLAGLPISGAIVGRALYEARFTLTEAIAHVEQASTS
jgi:phosphoribosylformimino-5-aminoimidazole carboxamide ribotide isomerase